MEGFKNNEKLYRAVKPPHKNKLFWTKDGKRITPLAFKNRPHEEYVSVNRQADRLDTECIQEMKKKLEGSIVSVTYSECRKSEINVIPKPSSNNIYHCGLFNGEADAQNSLLTDIQCQNLADMAIFEYKDFE
jgi:hypothetical protein